MVGKRTIIPCSNPFWINCSVFQTHFPKGGKYRHFCSSNCAKENPDEFNSFFMRDCGCCGVGQNAENFEGDFDECGSYGGDDY